MQYEQNVNSLASNNTEQSIGESVTYICHFSFTFGCHLFISNFVKLLHFSWNIFVWFLLKIEKVWNLKITLEKSKRECLQILEKCTKLIF